MGRHPALWGPQLWHTIHTLAYDYQRKPSNDELRISREEAYANWFNALPKLLPCPGCRMHLALRMQKTPPPIKDTQGTFKLWEWTVDLHNEVNKSTGKVEYTYDEARLDFLKRYSPTEYDRVNKTNADLESAHERANEANKKMLKLQDDLRKAIDNNLSRDKKAREDKVALMIVGSILGAILAIIFVAIMYVKYIR